MTHPPEPRADATGSATAKQASVKPAVTDKEAAIRKAALTLFAERGFHGTAVPLVAEAAGVAAGTIYRYFPSKEALVNAVFRDAKRALHSYLLTEGLRQAAPREQFHHIWSGLTRFAREHPVAFRFLELQDHVPYLDPDSLAVERGVLVPIYAFCEQARQAGLACELNSEALMALIWGAFVGLFKAELLGYLTLSEATLQAAEEACWRAACGH